MRSAAAGHATWVSRSSKLGLSTRRAGHAPTACGGLQARAPRAAMLARVPSPVALRTISLESRRSGELARLLERHGMVALQAPSLREVPLEDQTDAARFGRALFANECDVLVLLTGVGARALISALELHTSRE